MGVLIRSAGILTLFLLTSVLAVGKVAGETENNGDRVIGFDETVYGVAINPSTNKVYVATSKSLFVLDGDNHTTMKNLTFGFDFSQLAVNELTNEIYVTHRVPVDRPGDSAEDRISRVNGTTDTLDTSVTISDGSPVLIELDSGTDSIYFRKGFSPTIYVLNGSSYAISTAFTPDRESYFTINHNANRIYMSSYDENSPVAVSVLDGSSYEEIGPKVLLEDSPPGSYIGDIAIDSANQVLYVGVLDRTLPDPNASITIPSGSIYVFDVSADGRLNLDRQIEVKTPGPFEIDSPRNKVYFLDMRGGPSMRSALRN